MKLQDFALNEALNRGVHELALKFVNKFFNDNITEIEKSWSVPASYLNNIPTLANVDLERKFIKVLWRQYYKSGRAGSAAPKPQFKNGQESGQLSDKEYMRLKGRIENSGGRIIIYTKDYNENTRTFESLVETVEHELNHVVDFFRTGGILGNRRDKKDIDNLAAREYHMDTTPSNQTVASSTSVKNQKAYDYWNKVARYVMDEKEFNQKINELATIAENTIKRPIFGSFYELILKLYNQHGFDTRIIFETSRLMTKLRSSMYKRFRSRIIREPELWEAYSNIFQDGMGQMWLSGKL